MALQLRRGLNADRVGTTFAEGEPIWTTDTNVLYVGDGVTPGGIEVAGGGGGGVTEIIAGSNISVNTSTGAVTISGQPGGVTEIIAGTNIDVNTSTGAVTISLQSTSTYQNLEVIDTLNVGEQLSFGTGTYRLVWGQSPPGGDNQFFINGTGGSNVRLFYDALDFVQFNSPSQFYGESRFYTTATFNNTITVQQATIGLNTGTTARDFGYGAMPFNANNMKIELPNNGASLFFAFKNPSGAARNIGFSRQGNIVLQQGQIAVLFPTGLGLVANDGGPAQVSVSTTTNGVLYSSRVGANTSTGVFQTVQTNAGVNFSTLLDYNGLFTVPKDLLVTTTATVATLKFGDGTTMTTAPVNEADQSLNTTSDVTFNSVVISTTATVGALATAGNIDGSEGFTANMTGFRAGWYGGTAGYAFKNDTDTGMFSNGAGDLRFKIDSNNSALVDALGWNFQNSIAVTNTATVASVKFGDGTEMTTAATGNVFGDQSVYTTSSVTFGAVAVSTTATFNGDAAVNVNNTLTVAGMTIGVSNNVLIPNQITSSATNVLVQTPPTNGGAIIFNMNRFGVQRPLAITRTGGIAFDFGQLISPGQGANVGQLLIQAASTSTGTANTLFLTSGGITGSGPLSRGVFSDASGFTVGTRPSGGMTAFNSSVFDLHGGLTLPKSLTVGTTATVNSLSVTNAATANSLSVSTNLAVTNTATANEVVVGPDQVAIKSVGFNIIGVDNNWRVGNVLEVGSGSGSGYITSNGNHNLILQTSDNNGPGGSITLNYGDGAGVNLYSGNSQEFSVATFNTTSNTINYGLTVNGPATFTSPTTLAVFTATGLTAITGAVGQVAIVSNSAGGGNPNGMMAFWDTTHNRWSYVHDNSAV